jgi:biotin carboxyl carrier protein
MTKLGEITAPLPGVVWDIKVQEGQAVKAGDVILILEAMKMENEIMAPIDGVIKSINVKIGQQVMTGDILAVIG